MQQSSLWQAVLGEIELTVSRGSFATWFKHTQLLQCSDELAIIGVNNIFVKNQFEQRYTELLQKTLAHNGVSPQKIEFKIIPSQKAAPSNDDEPVLVTASVGQNTRSKQHGAQLGTAQTPASPQPSGAGNSLSHSYRQGINERYTFDNFIVGASNELAFAACQSISQNPGRKYNPLFLYGGVGIGKTHLIQAAGNAFLANNPGAKVLYISTEQFVQEFVDALRYRKTAEFASYYRSADMLIVDDIQFIAGKDKMEEEFFHTFNALHQANRQIIITSDTPPNEIPTIKERLRSRLGWGMTIDMQVPDFETRCAILQMKAHDHGVDLPMNVADFLATRAQTNIRELEGSLNQLLALCDVKKQPPSIEIATEMLGSTKSRPKHLSAKQIVERTARHFQTPLTDILGPKRDKDIVVPRQVAMYLLHEELGLSFPKIAKELGRKDHTTAIHSVRKVEKEVESDSDMRGAIAAIREQLHV